MWGGGEQTTAGLTKKKRPDQPSRAADLPLDVVHQEAEDAFVLLAALINAAGH